MLQPKPLLRTLDAAVRDLQHPRRHVRESAVKDLARLGIEDDTRRSALAALSQALLQDSEPVVRGACAVALADANATSALDAVVDAAKDEHAYVAQMALLALRELSPVGHRGACAIIRYHLGSDSPALRFQAVTAASRVMEAGFEAVVERALQDDDPAIRYLALRCSDERWASGLLPAPIVTAATSALDDRDWGVRVAAAMLLAPHGESNAREMVSVALNRRVKLPAPEDEQTLIELAGELGLSAAIPGLRSHLRGRFGLVPGRFAWQAQVALARLGDAHTITTLRRALRSRRRDVRTLAVAAVGQAKLTALEADLVHLESQGAVESSTLNEALASLRQQPSSPSQAGGNPRTAGPGGET